MSEEKRCLMTIVDGTPSVEFEGNWSRYEFDRLYRKALMELQQHKRRLMNEDIERRKREEEEQTEEEPKKTKGAKK